MHDLCVLDRKLHNQPLLLVLQSFLLGGLAAVGNTLLLRDRVADRVAVEPSQTHKRAAVRVVLDEAVPSAAAGAALFGDLAAGVALEDDLGLLDDTLAGIFAGKVGLDHLVSAALELLVREALALALLQLCGKTDDGFTCQSFQCLGIDAARNVAHGQTRQAEGERRVALDESFALLQTCFTHGLLGRRQALPKLRVRCDRALGKQV